MRTVYCISGLGADHRIFAKLNVPGIDFSPLSWMAPSRHEDIGTYANRMREGVPEDHPVLLGVSFGGMMAIEMAKKIPGATVIIVSSVSTRSELPLWMRLGGYLHIDRLSPAAVIKRGAILTRLENHKLGVESEEEALLCQEFRDHIDGRYLNWAIGVILRWRNEWKPASFYHFHGGKDHIFPIRTVTPTHIIGDGGHFMIYNRAEEIGRLLGGILAKLSWSML
ncbi:MAG TPA: alpha/beta hydrolase [Puia sp.]|nr:alpha/beta hydrolase [Puia sp.]